MFAEKTRSFAANSIFPSLFLGALACVLAEAWVAQLGGSWQAHLVFGMPGMSLSALACNRARVHWSAGTRRPPVGVRDFAWCLCLFATGILVALCVASVFLLGIVAVLIYLVPWAKVPVCRTRFVASSMVTLAGALACLALYGKALYGLHYAVAAWVVSTPSMLMMFLVLAALPASYRLGEPSPDPLFAPGS